MSAPAAGELPRWVKPLVWAVCLTPLVLLGLELALRPPVNPIETLIHATGLWSLRLLCVTLCMTPLRRWSGWTGWIRLRRLFGLFAFFYAVLHVGAYVGLDQFFDAAAILADILKRPFITVGLAAFLLLLPLAGTSNRRAMRRLGRRWQTLHRLIYLLTPVAVVHFWWLVKKDVSEPLLYAAIVAALLSIRLWWRLKAARG